MVFPNGEFSTLTMRGYLESIVSREVFENRNLIHPGKPVTLGASLSKSVVCEYETFSRSACAITCVVGAHIWRTNARTGCDCGSVQAEHHTNASSLRHEMRHQVTERTPVLLSEQRLVVAWIGLSSVRQPNGYFPNCWRSQSLFRNCALPDFQ
jgi:hypothetical protein